MPARRVGPVLLPLSLCLSGCVGKIITRGRPYLVTHGVELRRPSQIGQWTLRQQREDKIEHGALVLMHLMLLKPPHALAAEVQLVAICRKLKNGWPRFRGRHSPWQPYDPQHGRAAFRTGTPDGALAYIIVILADSYPCRRNYPHDAAVRRAMRRTYRLIRPSKAFPRALRAWQHNKQYVLGNRC